MRKKTSSQHGFTIIEAVVTIALIGIFAGFLFQFYFVVESQRIAVARRATATDIAFSNLDKIAAKSQVPACDASTDLTVTAGADGTDLIATGAVTAENTEGKLGSNVTQKLLVTYPRGCSTHMPARITSVVTYGDPSESVVHVSFVE